LKEDGMTLKRTLLAAIIILGVLFRIWASQPTWIQSDESYYINIFQNFVDRGELTPYMWRMGGDTNIIAGSGTEALEKFDTIEPDLVTLDILMPDIDGIQVLRKMKEKKPQLPVIMSTAYDYRDDFAVWASEAYLVKSSDLAELKSTIRKLLGGS